MVATNNCFELRLWIYSLAVLLFMGYPNLSITVGAAAESRETIEGGGMSTTCGGSESSSSFFSVRLHLIRHGETEANVKHLVLGQTDSPLTRRGVDQAKSANRAIGSYPFWRRYSSDLERCITTANLILDQQLDGYDTENEYMNNSKNKIILDQRLRERAKGVREGRSKHLTYDEAFEIFRRERGEAGTSASNIHVQEKSLEEDNIDNETPLLETEDEVFIRIQSWIEEILKDAYDDYLKKCPLQTDKHMNGQYDIFAVTHSGTLRILIEKLVGEQLPYNVQREETDKNGVQVGRLIVPNTSITKIDIFPDNDFNEYGQPTSMNMNLGEDRSEMAILRAKLIDFSNTVHLEEKENEISKEL